MPQVASNSVPPHKGLRPLQKHGRFQTLEALDDSAPAVVPDPLNAFESSPLAVSFRR